MSDAELGGGVDWRLTTWDGARREQLRRWAELPLERIILALEEMEEISGQLQQAPAKYERSGSDAARTDAAGKK